MSASRVVAVLLAGGTGTRVGHELPKQLLEVAGRPVIAHALEAFQRSGAVDEIVVMMTPTHLAEVQALVAEYGFGKVTRVLPGGDTRTASTRGALEVLEGDCLVLFHDAARPFVTDRIIAECVDALRGGYRAVTTAIDSADTIVTVRDGLMTGSLDRSCLARCQTPQGFARTALVEAYSLADEDPSFTATDDASVVARYLPDEPIGVVTGDARNFKITDAVDLRIAEALSDRP
ncbi:2-C-methyl-D-erythritol 4-phosphate cytidylyltransferase [Aeromicrobium phragmitis]|uniref:2-C-methyl-D-erythritol 4-phosphate cytidylyltransferase n=1 Tax=Aeromicrobium phragmitis TaxID=2478914 RepID=A0A3L8PQ62_9ACTN|nr:2-C-methyl-D-erythritol 4-phosphate cytidylyltransferase [Aeromicrobium phragmitis]RLV56588.1 2-C-methyl-D-erythritol 4-phosphate cytidylyltransferase [Aeromicrobium phragmitis]